MEQVPISLDEVAQGLHYLVGVGTGKGVETQVQITYVTTELNVLNKIPYIYR